jgi:hypothetical protein
LSFKVFHRFAGDLAAIDEESAFGPFEQDAVVTFARDDHLDVVGHVDADLELVAAL